MVGRRAHAADLRRGQGLIVGGPSVGVTPRDEVFQDGTARLLRFHAPGDPVRKTAAAAPVVVLVPSLINRWYVLDLRAGASVVEALVAGGVRVYAIDWGTPEDEDRYLGWDDVLRRLHRLVRAARRDAGVAGVGVLGYCMGATLAGIHTALHPDGVLSFVNLAGPFDFSAAGMLGTMTAPAWFDADAVAAAGNVRPQQMQAGFWGLRPTQHVAKVVGALDRWHDGEARAAFDALEAWAGDNVAFPAAAYGTYIRDLYQANALIRGEHRVGGRPIDLARITCPVLTVCASRDTICPPDAARGLHVHCGAAVREWHEVPGGHVGAVVGRRASRDLYPRLVRWFHDHTAAATPAVAGTSANP